MFISQKNVNYQHWATKSLVLKDCYYITLYNRFKIIAIYYNNQNFEKISLKEESHIRTQSLEKEMVKDYICIRCGYTTEFYGSMKNHLLRKVKPCPPAVADIEITEEVIKCIMERRTYTQPGSVHAVNPNIQQSIKQDVINSLDIEGIKASFQTAIKECQCASKALEQRIKTLESKVKRLETFYNKRSESYYQKILEKYLNGAHKKLPCGVTDVTNDRVHAEIKVWNNYKSGIGQLACYNKDDPRPELHIYFFGDSDQATMERITEMCIQNGVHPFEFQDYAHKTDIVDLETGDVVHVYVEPVNPQNSSLVT